MKQKVQAKIDILIYCKIYKLSYSIVEQVTTLPK